ncbi:hypothetical protein HMI56_006760 [Coelomomyces lativittatus]|nr:hypothetical protein HMI56_006760 [Coelomomyces lativittatus]
MLTPKHSNSNINIKTISFLNSNYVAHVPNYLTFVHDAWNFLLSQLPSCTSVKERKGVLVGFLGPLQVLDKKIVMQEFGELMNVIHCFLQEWFHESADSGLTRLLRDVGNLMQEAFESRERQLLGFLQR